MYIKLASDILSVANAAFCPGGYAFGGHWGEENEVGALKKKLIISKLKQSSYIGNHYILYLSG